MIAVGVVAMGLIVMNDDVVVDDCDLMRQGRYMMMGVGVDGDG